MSSFCLLVYVNSQTMKATRYVDIRFVGSNLVRITSYPFILRLSEAERNTLDQSCDQNVKYVMLIKSLVGNKILFSSLTYISTV